MLRVCGRARGCGCWSDLDVRGAGNACFSKTSVGLLVPTQVGPGIALVGASLVQLEHGGVLPFCRFLIRKTGAGVIGARPLGSFLVENLMHIGRQGRRECGPRVARKMRMRALLAVTL